MAEDQLVDGLALRENRQADDLPAGFDSRQKVADIQIHKTEITVSQLRLFFVDHRCGFDRP